MGIGDALQSSLDGSTGALAGPLRAGGGLPVAPSEPKSGRQLAHEEVPLSLRPFVPRKVVAGVRVFDLLLELPDLPL